MGNSPNSNQGIRHQQKIAKRTQRRQLHNLRGKIEKVICRIRKFTAKEENDEFNEILDELEHYNSELERREREIQPEVRNIYEIVKEEIDEAVQLLYQKLQENIHGVEVKRRVPRTIPNRVVSPKMSESVASTKTEDSEEESRENDEDAIQEARSLEQTNEKRKTVEIKLIKINPTPQTAEIEVHKPDTREQKRKSILKQGVRVMSQEMLNEINDRKSKIYFEDDAAPNTYKNNQLEQIKKIIDHLRNIEEEINTFIGLKNGTMYNKIKDQLLMHLMDISQMEPSGEETLGKWHQCKKYCHNCLTFLDERASENNTDDVFVDNNINKTNDNNFKKSSVQYRSTEDVFVDNNKNKTNDNNFKKSAAKYRSTEDIIGQLQKLTKTTAI